MKKYKLLKDLPYIKAGTEYIKADGFVTDKCSYVPDIPGMKHERFAMHADWVENNPEWFEEVKEKEYEILEFTFGDNKHGYLDPIICRNKNGNFGPYETKEQTLINSQLYKITKVRRLSDAEVFSVGDAAIDLYENTKTSITGFYIKDDIMCAMFDDHSCSDLKYLTKVKVPKIYTQSQLEEAEQKAFEAARKGISSIITNANSVFGPIDWRLNGSLSQRYTYSTYQDYKNSKK